MSEHPMKHIFDDVLASVKELADAKTIIGEPVVLEEGIKVIPISKAIFGFASGGSDFDSKKQETPHFGGGSGAGLTLTPVGFLVIQDGEVRLLQISDSVSPAERAIAVAPEIVNKVLGFFDKKSAEKEKRADEE